MYDHRDDSTTSIHAAFEFFAGMLLSWNSHRYIHTIYNFIHHPRNYCAILSVTLHPTNHTWCPGDTVVFTCVTDTGYLVWQLIEGTSYLYRNTKDQQTHHQFDIFTLNLTKITGSTLVSTATVYNVLLEHNGTVISCGDSANPIPVSITKKQTVLISGIYSYCM